MASTIVAGNITNGGTAISSDSTGILDIKTGTGSGTTALTIDASQNVTAANNLNATGFSSVSTFGFKKRIINGAMVIDQRNAGASVSVNSQYTLDRWYGGSTQSSKYSVQQNAGSVTPPVGFTNYLGVTSSSAYNVQTSDTFWIQQPIEGLNTADLAWGTASAATVTLSFWVRSSLTGTFGGALTNSVSSRSYPFSYTISAANTWEQKSVTITGDTTGTWLTTNGAGIIVRFGLGSGSTYTGTAGAWAASNLVQPTGTVSVVGTNGATWYVTGVQLEKGSTATSFDFRDYGRELMLCQRYYQTVSHGVLGYSVPGINCGANIMYTVPMRTTSTISITQSNTNAGSTVIDSVSSISFRYYAGVISTGGYQINAFTVASAEF